MAVVSSPRERVVGVGYYLIEDNRQLSVAQPAILVEDRFQGQGLGRIMLQGLYQQALARGIRAFLAHIDSANTRMMNIIQRSGLPFEVRSNHSVQEVHILLDDGAMARAA